MDERCTAALQHSPGEGGWSCVVVPGRRTLRTGTGDTAEVHLLERLGRAEQRRAGR